MIIQWKWPIQGIRSDKQSAWRTMDGDSQCTGGSDQDDSQEKRNAKRKNDFVKKPYR